MRFSLPTEEDRILVGKLPEGHDRDDYGSELVPEEKAFAPTERDG
jgi:hypothetical protein